jgi:hypothetical protein
LRLTVVNAVLNTAVAEDLIIDGFAIIAHVSPLQITRKSSDQRRRLTPPLVHCMSRNGNLGQTLFAQL